MFESALCHFCESWRHQEFLCFWWTLQSPPSPVTCLTSGQAAFSWASGPSHLQKVAWWLGPLPRLCQLHPAGLPRVFCIRVWLCTDRLACGIKRAAAIVTGLAGPKICAPSTSRIALRKRSTIQDFLKMFILENTYVTQSRQSVFEKQVYFWHEWVGIMKISAQVRQMFVLSFRNRKAARDFQSCWAEMGKLLESLTCPSSGFWRSIRACSAEPLLAQVSLAYFPLVFIKAAFVFQTYPDMYSWQKGDAKGSIFGGQTPYSAVPLRTNASNRKGSCV